MVRFARSTDDVEVAFEMHGEYGPVVLFPMRMIPWRRWGYIDELAATCRLLIVDPRGHGDSSRLANIENYGLWKRCDDLLAAADHAHVETFIAFGFSNTALTAHALATTTRRVSAVLCGGMGMIGFGDANWQGIIEHCLEERQKGEGTYIDGGTYDYGEAASLYRDVADWVPERLNVPAILYFGSRDPFGEAIRTSRSAHEALGYEVREFDGYDHDTAISSVQLVAHLIAELCDRVA